MHKIVKCKKCKEVIMQCRCFALDKPVEYSICDNCKGKDNVKD